MPLPQTSSVHVLFSFPSPPCPCVSNAFQSFTRSQPCLGGLAVSHLRISNHARVLILVVLGTMSCSRGSCLHVNVLHCLASSSYSHMGCDSPRSLVHPAFPVFLVPSAIVH